MFSIINTCEKQSNHNIGRWFIKRLMSSTSSDNKWYNELQPMATNDNEWQQLIASGSTNENE